MAELLPHSGIIKDGEHILPLRIYYEDTDAGGVVYHANYLKFMERGRSDMLRLVGINQVKMLQFMEPDDFKFFMVRTEVDYVKSAILNDEITIHTRVTKFGGASIIMDQVIRRAGDIIAKGRVRAAVLNKDDKPMRLPKTFVEKLSALI
ncbi:MAG: YbgC/FadM family acyl-CoA thioesterase [Emcibacter sp.]|nr:YbgC/FadM family acyl-CoA thioesterase [Emcibacter sp.]